MCLSDKILKVNVYNAIYLKILEPL